jgi:hypothetical protein
MIELDNKLIDPKTSTLDEIKAMITHIKRFNQTHIRVIWDDSEFSQTEMLELYLPITRYAQSLGLEVNCIMSVYEAKRLVKYPKLMFVDPLFLRKFRFKTIRFDLHDIKELSA